jgi:hypothetical protein
MAVPHYLRFARVLALAGGVASSASGCGTATTSEPPDAYRTDAFFDCTTCTCGEGSTDAGLPICPGQQVLHCGCAAVGPLAPPDLAT